ncbi:MAG: 4-(cytidine 5'-diphospho)-2-C-methyl-D-erythritol kinase [Clostridia bacterium]
MESITQKAYAKLNLTLGVLYKRTDGYHALDTLMQSIDLHDTVTCERATDVLVTASGMLLPYENTLKKAADRYCALTGKGAHIRVVKRIPAEAGMGGGSADAAAVLVGMQRLYGDLGEEQLYDAALSVGADVPFCLYAQLGGSLARAEGVGEKLTSLASTPLHFVVVKPKAGVSTRALFSSLKLIRKNPDNTAAMRAISDGDVAALSGLLYNVLEEPATELVPEICTLKRRLREAGALGAAMTGSGSGVFGLFENEPAANTAAEMLSDIAYCRACRSL